MDTSGGESSLANEPLPTASGGSIDALSRFFRDLRTTIASTDAQWHGRLSESLTLLRGLLRSRSHGGAHGDEEIDASARLERDRRRFRELDELTRLIQAALDAVETSPAGMASRGAKPEDAAAPALSVFHLSPFRVLLDGGAVTDWPNCRGRSIFNYLVTHRGRPVPREKLMERFWPRIDGNQARNNLNVAIYGLRKALAKVGTARSYVLFKDGCYSLSAALSIWVDGEAFMQLAARGADLDRHGDVDASLATYQAAAAIYQNDYLADEREDDWVHEVRQRFRNVFLSITDHLSRVYLDRGDSASCISVCSRMLEVDRCNEEPHRRLMRCYSRSGQQHLALRQYFACRDALALELDTTPGVETVRLFDQVRRRQDV